MEPTLSSCLCDLESFTVQSPKSISFTLPPLSMRTFSSLMSLCPIPCAVTPDRRSHLGVAVHQRHHDLSDDALGVLVLQRPKVPVLQVGDEVLPLEVREDQVHVVERLEP